MWYISTALACFLLLFSVNILPFIKTAPYWVNHLMHFSGGVCAGYLSGSVMAFALNYKSFVYRPVKIALIALAIFAGAICAGSIWEEYEYWYVSHEEHQKWTPVSLYEDTMNDIRFDRLGGASVVIIYLALLVARRIKNKTVTA